MCADLCARHGDDAKARNAGPVDQRLSRASGVSGSSSPHPLRLQAVFDYLKPIADTPLIKFDKPLVVRIRDEAAKHKGRNQVYSDIKMTEEAAE